MSINNLKIKFVKWYVVGILLTLIAFDGKAQVELSGLLVELKDGSKQTFLFSSLPRVTFSEGTSIITTAEMTTEYPMVNVQRISIAGESKDNTLVVDAKENLKIDLSNTEIAVIRGLPTGDTVNVYDLKGLKITSVKVDESGVAEISLCYLERGNIYIINTQKITFKLYKK